MKMDAPAKTKSEETKLLLLKAATTAFAYDGFHGTSLKKIAREAGVNQALISYHFGNKEGLYLAVFETIVGQIQTQVGPRVQALQATLGIHPSSANNCNPDPDSLKQALFSIADAMLELLCGDAGHEWALLITREQVSPTEAFEILYSGFMGKMLGLVSQVMQMLKPGLSEEEAKMFAILFMGQIIVFRVSRTAVLRHMGWQGYGEGELALVEQQLHQSICSWLAE